MYSLAAACKFTHWTTNPLRGSRTSTGSLCGTVRICPLAGKPFAGILRVEASESVARREFLTLPTIVCVEALWRCGAMQMPDLADEPSARIARVELNAPAFTRCVFPTSPVARAVEALLRWRRANFQSNPLRGSCASKPSGCGTV